MKKRAIERGPDKARRKRRYATTVARIAETPNKEGLRELEIVVTDKASAFKGGTRWLVLFNQAGELVGPMRDPMRVLRKKHLRAARAGARHHAREATKQLPLFKPAALAPEAPATPTHETREGAM